MNQISMIGTWTDVETYATKHNAGLVLHFRSDEGEEARVPLLVPLLGQVVEEQNVRAIYARAGACFIAAGFPTPEEGWRAVFGETSLNLPHVENLLRAHVVGTRCRLVRTERQRKSDGKVYYLFHPLPLETGE